MAQELGYGLMFLGAGPDGAFFLRYEPPALAQRVRFSLYMCW